MYYSPAMTRPTLKKQPFNAEAKRRLKRPAAFSDADMERIETQIILFNAAKNNVMDTFERMPRDKQLRVMDMQNTKDGFSPLMNACMNGHSAVADHLVKLGAKTELRDHDGRTALNHATARGSLPIISILLDAGVDIDTPDNVGCTPLMTAVLRKNYPVVSLLLERGCDLNAGNVTGSTALELAQNNGATAIAALITDIAKSRHLQAELSGIQQGLAGDLTVSRPLTLKKPVLKKPRARRL